MISGFKHLANKKPLGNQHLTTTSSVTTEIQGEYSSVVTLVKKGLDLRGFFRPHNSSGINPIDSVQRPQRRFKEDYLQAKFITDSISALSGYIQARSWKATYQRLEIPHAKTNHGSEPQTNLRLPTLTNSCYLEIIIYIYSTWRLLQTIIEHIPYRFPTLFAFPMRNSNTLSNIDTESDASDASRRPTWRGFRQRLRLGHGKGLSFTSASAPCSACSEHPKILWFIISIAIITGLD